MANSSTHLDLKREARRWFRTWARGIAEGRPRPENVIVLRAGAILAAPQPGALLDGLVEAARQDPEIIPIEEPADE